MASADGSSSLPGSGLWRRMANPSSRVPPPSSGVGRLRPDIDLPPRPRPVLQALSFALVLVLAALQFLPATHFRHPFDPKRIWVPFVSNSTSATSTNRKDPLKEKPSDVVKLGVDVQRISVVSWANCLDLRVLAVLTNSTLSSSRLSEHVYFSFFVPEDEYVKSSYYKLKVLFPDSHVEFLGQNEVKEKLRTATAEWKSMWSSIYQLTSFVIPSTNPSLRKYVFVRPDTIIRGSIEELFGLDLGPYAIAAVEDCSKRLGDYVNIDILNAIQRTAAKTWISEKPYDKDACVADLRLLLVDAAKLEKAFLESILWWNQVLNLKHERNNQTSIVIAVAFYNKYLKLSDTWRFADSRASASDSKVLLYDGPTMNCLQHKNRNEQSDFGNLWRQYLAPKFDAILTN